MGDFDSGDSGASMTYPQQCSAIKKGGYVCIKGQPCKVVDMSTSKTGKHGHAKVHLVALNIFTGKKLEELCPSTHNLECPFVQRKDYQLCDIGDDGYLSLMLDDGSMKEDIKMHEDETTNKIREEFDEGKDITVSILSSMGQDKVVAYKTTA